SYFLEVQDHGMPEQKKVNKGVAYLHRKLGLEMVATNDVHYINKEDSYYQDVLLCIQTGSLIKDEDRMRMPNREFYLKDPDTMATIFRDYERAIENTQKIAERCNVEIKFHEPHLPYYTKLPVGLSNLDYLKLLVNKGLTEKYEEVTDEIVARAKKEIDVINSMGYVDYFLI